MGAQERTGWKRLTARLAPRDRSELSLLVGALGALTLALLFFFVAAQVFEGNTRHFDEHILRALRRADDPATPIGPHWLQTAAFDITALGGPTVLGLSVLAVTGYLLLLGLFRTALFVFVASSGGWVLNAVLKDIFHRARPDIVPHLREVMSESFPSGHAMTSAAVYLTLGALLMRISERRVAKFYCMTVAMMATAIVGLSRVYLGVHYPTDVLAGWLVGLCWAVLCWTVERWLERRAGLKREQKQAG